ncbi:hypothetical protein RHMOL_Rhmol11G0237400 [Rhododendron molle]|uniref:Uncharacterized protein n=1 Tax=Rhododendron molle TaxID=49168 RepID=A0ACC0LWM0_RHOML|nr:hypothetical protein RHMOL_Rhmol11G0237400 [Rhododendron molle]
MLPTVSRGRTPSHVRSNSNPVFPQYLRRIVKVPLSQRLLSPPMYPHAFVIDGKGREGEQRKYGWHDQFEPWQQMDIEYTFWQMLHLCTSPKIVYVYLTGIVVLVVIWRMLMVGSDFLHVELNNGCSYQHTKYHKQTKNQWARDDPAFIVVCSLLLVVSTLAYCVAYDHSTAHAVFVIISVLLFHFYLTGVVVATCCWFLTNNYLREEAPNSHVVEQRVEWQVQKLCTLYAFDVHCNSFFPMFVMLYVMHYFLSPLLVAHGFIPVLLSNLLFMVAVSSYHYLNFLGYDGKLNTAVSGTYHFFLVSYWHCHHPFTYLDSERLQSIKILHEHVFQSTLMISLSLTLHMAYIIMTDGIS